MSYCSATPNAFAMGMLTAIVPCSWIRVCPGSKQKRSNLRPTSATVRTDRLRWSSEHGARGIEVVHVGQSPKRKSSDAHYDTTACSLVKHFARE
jgi:hypothetical protein